MAREIPVTQARADLAELVNRVAYSGERIVLTRHGKAQAALVSPADLQILEELANRVIDLTDTGRPAGIHPASAQGEPADPLRIAAELRQDLRR